MDHLNTRTELVEFICKHVPSAMQRACYTGTVNVLGGFSIIPPSTRPGWIVAVTSVHGRTWFIVVGPLNEDCQTYSVWMTDRIPWQFYIDDRVKEDTTYSLFAGDNPERARLMREVAGNDRIH